ncbi:type VII secretion protein EccCa [Streptomyces tsukubensis]|uniref:ATP-binding protein n=1 Tax=Streptomyces tsukubensis TaxID=83656 RepID=A0A1V4A002_9ACTN|nr:type VII secretion protein EccCa [Streptomyces tsukubensis]OON71824.1 ATP-binding protein [Streptomyces tsukubensis]QFR93690.1 type VII secretion protein EccCa [Streptomyces tsukubensis]
MSRIIFHRSARIVPPQLPTEPVVLSAPPQPAGKDQGANWIYLLMPLLSSISMAAYLMSGGRKLLVLLGIAFVVLSIGVTVAVRVQMRGQARKKKTRARDLYLEHLVEVREAARQVADNQRLVAAWTFPSPYRLWAIAAARRRVWERRVTDPDFLRVCVGVGKAPLSTPIRLATRNDPTVEYDTRAKAAADRLIESMITVGGQPAVVDLGRAGVVSVLGPSDTARGVVRAVLSQIAVLHAPDDVAVAIATGGEDWEWAKWLPHAHEAEATGEAGVVPLVAEDFESIADYLRKRLDQAAGQPGARRGLLGNETPDTRQRLLVVLDRYDPRAAWARSQLATELTAVAGPATGITVICLVDRENDEPTRADTRVRVKEDGTLTLEGRRGEPRSPVTDVIADRPEPRLCEAIARTLAPLRLSVEGDEVLAQTMSLPSMLGVADLGTFEPEQLWVDADAEDVLRMPIGFDGNGQPLVLDLKESAQGGMGPHGLIVGATGSGKSELLRTLVTGLTMTHSPELLSLVLVDFKGGATFAGVTELPHVAGLITNLVDDLALVDRVLDALTGEQQRRQRMLRDAGNVDTVREYQLRRAAGAKGQDGRPLEPLPYLLIVVDEFGELLSARPDFIDLFVQIGRVGRSLGMHLLLATQRLEEGRLRGLESNLSYRICLRTFSAAESRAVIGVPDAYRLPPIPGSAYLKVTESVFERFRVAHVSGAYESAEERELIAGPPPSRPVAFGLRVPPTPDADPAGTPAPRAQPALTGPTEMQTIVNRLGSSGQAAHQVWLPPLPAALSLDDLTGPVAVDPDRGLSAEWWPHKGELRFPVGVLDVPLQQLQHPLITNFAESGHLALVGAPQSGKSTLLRTLMLSAMLTHTPDEAQFLCLDFGGGTMQPFERAPHVSGVAGRHDLPQAGRVLAETLQLIAERERLFRHLGLDSAAEFRRLRASGGLPPSVRTADVFLVIDNWGAARGEIEGIDTAILDIAARGLGVAVHLILSANRWADLRMSLRDVFSARLELRLNDPTDSEINRRLARQYTGVAPGRGMAPPGTQYQAALPRLDGEDSTDGLADAQSDAISRMAEAWNGRAAPSVRMLPDRVGTDELALPEGDSQPGVPIGIGESDLAPVHLDLTATDPHFLVFGDSGSGKSAFLRTWMTGLAERRSAWEARFIVIDYRRSLLGVVPPDHLGAYAGDANAATVYVEQVAAKLAERLPPHDVTTEQLRERSWWAGPEFYVVVDDYDLVGGGHRSPLAPLIDYLPQARELGLHLVTARRVSGLMRGQMSEPLLSRLRELGADGLILSGDHREGPLLGDQRAAQRPPGRGVLVRRQSPTTLIQVALVKGE